VDVSGVRADEEVSGRATRKLRWLPVLEDELRHRMGWVDAAISPFARAPQRPVKAKPAVHLPRADTLLFPSGERKTA